MSPSADVDAALPWYERLFGRPADAQPMAGAMKERGLDAGPLDDTTSDKVLIAMTADPEGNAITLVEQR
ncbi:MAG: hypothetical protein ACRDL3_12855 [Solirubrobacterales bacterium]